MCFSQEKTQQKRKGEDSRISAFKCNLKKRFYALISSLGRAVMRVNNSYAEV